jgi:hypothetical protein
MSRIVVFGIQDIFPSGATVSRLHTDNSIYLRALFMSEDDAELFAQACIKRDTANTYSGRYLVACTYSGRVKMFSTDQVTNKEP